MKLAFLDLNQIHISPEKNQKYMKKSLTKLGSEEKDRYFFLNGSCYTHINYYFTVIQSQNGFENFLILLEIIKIILIQFVMINKKCHFIKF